MLPAPPHPRVAPAATQALTERLKLLDCTPDDIRRFTDAHPAESRLTPGIVALVAALRTRGVAVYLISGGFRELIRPLAKLLGLPMANVYANRMNWQFDDDSGTPVKCAHPHLPMLRARARALTVRHRGWEAGRRLVGFDPSMPVAHNKGKPEAIQALRRQHPYENVVMIGDGITDLEAAQETGAADLFIGYGGVVVRPCLAAQLE